MEKRCGTIALELAEEIEEDPQTVAVIPLRVMNRTRDARPVHGRVVVTFRPASTGKPEGGLELTDANVRDPLKQIAARHGLAARGSWIPSNSSVDMVVPLDIPKDVTLVYSDITEIIVGEYAGGFGLGLKPTSDGD
ncbi:MAG: hypothetical protein ACE5JM_11185 [Armatimonadota bacterium]